MRIRRKRKSERKKDLRDKYKREELKKKRVINDELKDGGRKSRRVTPGSTTANPGSQTGSQSSLYVGGEGNRGKYKIGREYYKKDSVIESEKLKEIRRKKQKIDDKQEKRRKSKRIKQRTSRAIRPARRVIRGIGKVTKKSITQTIKAPDKTTRMMEDDFNAMGVAEKGITYLLKKVAGMFAKAAAFLFQSALNGFLTIFGPAIVLDIIVVIFLIYVINWSPWATYFVMDLGTTISGSVDQEEEQEYPDIYTYVEGRLRFRTVLIMSEKQEENPYAELTADELTEDVVYDAVVVTYAIASSEEIYGSDISVWISSEEGTKKIDELAKDMVYAKNDKIKYRSLEKIKEMSKYEELLSDIEAYEEVVKEEKDD